MDNTIQNKKVLYVITKGNWGGAQRYVFDLATGLPAEHCEVVVAVGTKDGNALTNALEKKGVRTIPIERLGRDVSVRGDWGSFILLWKIIRTEKPDVLHLNSPKAAGLGALAGRFLAVPRIIVTAHGFTWNEERPLYQRLAIKLLSWITIKLAHTTITISHREKAEAYALPFIREAEIAIVHNGVSKLKKLSGENAYATLGIPHAPHLLTIGSIGELHQNKGFEYLLSAITKLPKHLAVRLVIVGGGERREALEALIAKHSLGDRVHLVGPKANAASLLSAFDIYILPSIKEGLPYVLLEAGSAGLPIISTDVGGVREIIDDMKSGMLIKPKNAEEIAQAIVYLYEHTENRSRFGKAIAEKISGEFSLEKMREKTYTLYTHS